MWEGLEGVRERENKKGKRASHFVTVRLNVYIKDLMLLCQNK